MPLLINDDELKQLDDLIGNVRTREGLPIINFFQQIATKRVQEANAGKVEVTPTDSKKDLKLVKE